MKNVEALRVQREAEEEAERTAAVAAAIESETRKQAGDEARARYYDVIIIAIVSGSPSTSFSSWPSGPNSAFHYQGAPLLASRGKTRVVAMGER